MASPQDPMERGTPNPTPPRTPPTLGDRTPPPYEARPERPTKFTEHLDDDDPAHAFEYSETWRLLQESETTSETPEAGTSTPNQTVLRRSSRKESRIIRRVGSRPALKRTPTPSSPLPLSPAASQIPQPPSASRSRASNHAPDGQGYEHHIPEPPSISRSRASTNAGRRAFEELRPLNEHILAFEGSSESDQAPRSAQKQPLHSKTSQRKIPVTKSPGEPTPVSSGAIIPSITVSPPNQPIPPPLDGPGEVRFSDVHQSRQTVRTYSNADGSQRRHLSFRRKPNQKARNTQTSSGAPDDVDKGELGDVDTNDDDGEPVSDLTILADRIRRRMSNHFAPASGRAPPPLKEDWEPYGYWDDGKFYEWRDIDWLGRPRSRDRSVSPTTSGKDNDKGKASGGNFLSRVWRKLVVKDRKREGKRKGKGKGKGKEKRRAPKYKNHDDYEMELQRHRERREQEARGGMLFEGSEAERDRLSTVGIRPASSSNDGDNEGDVSLGASMVTDWYKSQLGDKKKQGPSFLDFFTRLCRKK